MLVLNLKKSEVIKLNSKHIIRLSKEKKAFVPYAEVGTVLVMNKMTIQCYFPTSRHTIFFVARDDAKSWYIGEADEEGAVFFTNAIYLIEDQSIPFFLASQKKNGKCILESLSNIPKEFLFSQEKKSKNSAARIPKPKALSKEVQGTCMTQGVYFANGAVGIIEKTSRQLLQESQSIFYFLPFTEYGTHLGIIVDLQTKHFALFEQYFNGDMVVLAQKEFAETLQVGKT